MSGSVDWLEGPGPPQNRCKVIGLSRFLIRPGLRVPNLASRCYGLVLRQVAGDWQTRYGVKPVLVETYVDRVHHQGVSLSAANWRRLGESKGRGRDDRQRQKAKSLKDLWVYEWDDKARQQLQACAGEVLAPRSVFAPAVQEEWVEEEMAGVELGDQRFKPAGAGHAPRALGAAAEQFLPQLRGSGPGQRSLSTGGKPPMGNQSGQLASTPPIANGPPHGRRAGRAAGPRHHRAEL